MVSSVRPLAESGIIGTGIGLALRGYRPVCESSSTGSSTRPTTRSSLSSPRWRTARSARSRCRSSSGCPSAAASGPSSTTASPEASFAHIAGLRVVSCSNPADAYWMLRQAVACDDPVLFLGPSAATGTRARCSSASAALRWGCTRPASRVTGEHVAVASVRTHGEDDTDAAAAAEPDGTSHRGRRSATCARSTSRPSRRPCCAPGGWSSSTRRRIFLGLGAEIAARITEQCFQRAGGARCSGSAASTRPYPASRLEDPYLPDLDRVLDAVDRWLAFEVSGLARSCPRAGAGCRTCSSSVFLTPARAWTEAEIVTWRVRSG